MPETKKINLHLSTLKSREYELSALLKGSDNHNVQYIRAMTGIYNPEIGGVETCLTEHDFNPTLMPWPSCLDVVWGNKAEPNRAKNSLPRYSGHITVPTSNSVAAHALLVSINQLKLDISQEAKRLHDIYGHKKMSRYTDTLKELEVFDDTENYQMTIRRLLFTDIETPVDAININWRKNPMSTEFKGNFEKLRSTYNNDTHGYLIAALEEYNRKHPGTIFAKRFYSPPTIFGKIKIGGEWGSAPHAVSTPIIVLKHCEKTKFKTKLERLEVVMQNGSVRSVEALKDESKNKSRRGAVMPIPDLANWYALLS